ncbi:pectinesterase family protein [Clostridium felsineum]|uniref:Pectinesterase A n=1 Tax=Clostridium felsineum TaxID=36839 RepID=A0A1S8M963_9CLOT|nr:pectinesterase family protein [Clostridium felsineum]URZ07397.1 Pectinesterase A [Clostridium felsineum]URZ12428.1 Pectinesterase A [Clostridium felsineum]
MKKKFIAALILAVSTTLLVLGISNSRAYAASTYNSIVDSSFKGTDGTKLNGIPTYKTITSALNSAPASSNVSYKIYIKTGTYYEKLNINKPNIYFVGENENTTKLTYNVASGSKKNDGTTYGTSGSASLNVSSPSFGAENLTIENSFDYPKNLAKKSNDPSKLQSAQAVALNLSGSSNKAYFKNCKITGYQDTLCSNTGTSYFTNCYISGCIDFIFGAGQSFFNSCNIVSVDMKTPSNNGYITAASTNISNKYGFVFYKCSLQKQTSTMATNSVSLGRPWHPTITLSNGTREADPNAIASVIYMHCNMDNHIKSSGWDSMTGIGPDGKTKIFTPGESRFYEYQNKGPENIVNSSRKQLNDTDALKVTIKNVLNGWNPQ